MACRVGWYESLSRSDACSMKCTMRSLYSIILISHLTEYNRLVPTEETHIDKEEGGQRTVINH